MAVIKKTVLKRNGFTLLEILVVLAIFSILGVVTTSILFTTLRSATKADTLREVKQNGDYAIRVMERLIRNANEVTICTPAANTLTIVNTDGSRNTFTAEHVIPADVSKIAINPGVYLTNDKVTLEPARINFTCTHISGQPDVITVSFTLRQAGQAKRVEESAQVSFQTTASLRTY
jgi:prepilin-type N-terminal cleavage/methylation domain-containing protein